MHDFGVASVDSVCVRAGDGVMVEHDTGRHKILLVLFKEGGLIASKGFNSIHITCKVYIGDKLSGAFFELNIGRVVARPVLTLIRQKWEEIL